MKRANQLASLKLPPEAESLALAQLYQGHNLVAEAIQALETLAAGGSQAAATYRKLGDFYLQSGVNLLAEQNYLKALDLSQTAGDVEGQAECQKGLGEVYAGLGQRDQAIQWLNRALENYITLGDKAMTSQITQRLDQLK